MIVRWVFTVGLLWWVHGDVGSWPLTIFLILVAINSELSGVLFSWLLKEKFPKDWWPW